MITLYLNSFRCINVKQKLRRVHLFPKTLNFNLKTTTRSQKRKAVAELFSGEYETSVAENYPSETLVAGPSKTPRIVPENLEEIKTSLRKEILSGKGN